MRPTTPANWALAALICLLLGSLHHLDGPSDIEAAQDVAADVLDATTQAKTRFASTNQGDQP